MANYQLGPVIGKIGGQVEVITEQVDIGGNSSRTWTLPDGWEDGYIGVRGEIEYTSFGSTTVEVLGETVSLNRGTRFSVSFQSLSSPAVISIPSSKAWWRGIVTLIRTA